MSSLPSIFQIRVSILMVDRHHALSSSSPHGPTSLTCFVMGDGPLYSVAPTPLTNLRRAAARALHTLYIFETILTHRLILISVSPTNPRPPATVFFVQLAAENGRRKQRRRACESRDDADVGGGYCLLRSHFDFHSPGAGPSFISQGLYLHLHFPQFFHVAWSPSLKSPISSCLCWSTAFSD